MLLVAYRGLCPCLCKKEYFGGLDYLLKKINLKQPVLKYRSSYDMGVQHTALPNTHSLFQYLESREIFTIKLELAAVADSQISSFRLA